MGCVVKLLECILECHYCRLVLLNLEVGVGIKKTSVVQTALQLLNNLVERLYSLRLRIALDKCRERDNSLGSKGLVACWVWSKVVLTHCIHSLSILDKV